MTKINRSGGAEQACPTAAGWRAAGRSAAVVKKYRRGSIFGTLNDFLGGFGVKANKINFRLWATVVLLSPSLFGSLETVEESLAQTIYSHGSM